MMDVFSLFQQASIECLLLVVESDYESWTMPDSHHVFSSNIEQNIS